MQESKKRRPAPLLQVAVIREVGGSGPLCSLVLAVTVLKDVLLFVLFALNLELVALVRGGSVGRAAECLHA